MLKQRQLILTIASLALLATSGLQAQSRNLELQTDQGSLSVPLDDAFGVQILPDGDISATATPEFSCQQGASCDDVEVSMAGGNGALIVSPTTIGQGSNVQVTWDSRGAWECSGTGLPGTSWNTNNPKAASGSVFVDTDNVPLDTYTMELTCVNGPVNDSLTAQLTVEEESDSGPGDITLPAVCDQVTELREFAGWSQATDVDTPFGSDEEQLFSLFFGPWPGTGNSGNLGIPKNEYMSVVFETGNLDSGSGGQVTRNPPALDGSHTSIGGGPLIASWSRCPGDFDPNSPALDSPGCVISAFANFIAINWGGPGSGAACELQPDTQYFLNIVYTTSDPGELPPVQAPCSDEPRCGNLYRSTGNE